MRRKFLPSEARMVEQLVLDGVTNAPHSTLCYDGWTDNTGQSVWSFTANLPDGHCYLLRVINGSSASHTQVDWR